MTLLRPVFMFVFPGQGSQYRGMGEDLCREFSPARAVYRRASEVLGYDVAELSFRDPEDRLDVTRYTQPALLTHSIACLEVFRDLTDGKVEPGIAAGHSLGEYGAMVAAEVLSFEDSLRLVSRRGEVMSQLGKGQMLAVPLDLENVRCYAERHYCGIGGCNLPNQTVIGGLEGDLEALVADLRREHPSVRPTPLRTEGAFHTYLMIDAAVQFRRDLEQASFRPPRCRVLSNYTGEFHDPDPDSFRHRLFFQLFNPVRWAWSFQRALDEHVSMVIELGGGIGGGDSPASKKPNLASITKRIAKARRGRFGRRSVDTRVLDYEPLYAPGIQVESLRQAAHLARAVLHIRPADERESASIAPPVGGPWHGLFVPSEGGVPLQIAADALQKVAALGLVAHVHLFAEEAADSAAVVALYEPSRTGPAPYLEQVVSGESAAVVHYIGAELDQQLAALGRALPADEVVSRPGSRG